jgi:hypothetical protein
MRRSAFDSVHDFCERIRVAERIPQRLKNQVNVIGHHHDCMQENERFVVVKAVVEHEVSCVRFENEAIRGAEC